jgi:hypothetical protein
MGPPELADIGTLKTEPEEERLKVLLSLLRELSFLVALGEVTVVVVVLEDNVLVEIGSWKLVTPALATARPTTLNMLPPPLPPNIIGVV